MSTNSDSSNKSRCVADALGLGYLDDGEEGIDVDLLRDLYRHARNDDGQRALFEHDPTFKKGWVNLDSARARELVSAFVPLDEAEDLKHARRMAQSNLEAQAWNDLLGIAEPPIQCRVKIHGNKWALRFQSVGPCLRGNEKVNEELPPIPGTAPAPATAQPIAPPPAPAPLEASSAPETSVAADVLRLGGLPS